MGCSVSTRWFVIGPLHLCCYWSVLRNCWFWLVQNSWFWSVFVVMVVEEICWIYVCVISSQNVNISRETLFLIDIHIINLFVLMSFDNYIYLILKKVDSYLSILNICEMAVLFGLYCVMCWTGTFVIFLPEIYYCVVILWYQSLCLMYHWCSKGIINEIGYEPVFFLWSTVIKVFCCLPVAVIPAFVVYIWIFAMLFKILCKCSEFLFYFPKKIIDGILVCIVYYE